MTRSISPNDVSWSKKSAGTACRNDYSGADFYRCRNIQNCDGCYNHYVRFMELKVGAESFMARQTLFVTLTFNDESLPLAFGAPEPLFKQYMQNMRRMFGGIRAVPCFEYGSFTGRPHFHAILFFHDRLPQFPLNVRTDLKGWSHGFSQYEPPVTVGGVASYTLGYIAKKGGTLLRPSNGLGKQYFINYAAFLARNRRPLLKDEFGIRVAVPNLEKTSLSKGDLPGQRRLKEFLFPPSHHWGQLMADAYIQAWRDRFSDPVPFDHWDQTSWTY